MKPCASAPRRLHCTVLVLIAAIGCVNLGGKVLDPSDWLEFHSQGIAVVGNAPRAELEVLVTELSIFIRLVEELLNAPVRRPAVPIRIYVFDRYDAFRAFAAVDWAGGQMNSEIDGHYAILPLDQRSYVTRSVLLHEYAHILLRANPHFLYPAWYDEGFADLLSNMRIREDLVIVGSVVGERLSQLQRDETIDLESLFSVGSGTESGEMTVSAFYAQSWVVMHYLNTSPERRTRLRNFVGQIGRGDAWQKAFAENFDMPLSEMEDQIELHVRRLSRGVPYDLAYFSASELAEGREWSVQSLPPAQVLFELAEYSRMLVDAGFDDKRALSSQLFKEALEFDPSYAPARAGLSRLLAGEGEFRAARSALTRALTEAPDDTRVQLSAGYVYARQAELEGQDASAAQRSRLEARQAFERAIELSPESPAAYAGLGSTYLGNDEDARKGIALLEQARSFGGYSTRVELDLAELYLTVEECELARQRISNVVRHLHGDESEEARRAKELLANISGGDAPATSCSW